MHRVSSPFKILYLLFSTLIFIPFPVTAQRSVPVPSTAPLTFLRFSINDGGGQPSSIRALIAPLSANYYLFPILDISQAEISLDGEDFVPLFGKDGRTNIRNTKKPVSLRIKVRDVLNTNLEQSVYKSLEASTDPLVKNKIRNIPDVDNEWTAILEVRNPDEGGKFIPVGMPWSFSRDTGTDSQTMKFKVDVGDSGSPFDLLHKASADDLRLILTTKFKAVFRTTEYQVVGELLDSSTRTVLQSVTSKAGDQQAVLFVPVGGAVKQKLNIKDIVRRNINIRVETREGQQVPQEEVKEIVARIVQQFQDQTKLRDQDKQTLISFLLDNGIRVTTPLGEVKHLTDKLLKEEETSTHDLLNTISRGSKKIAGGLANSVSVLDIVSASQEGNFNYESMSDDQKTEVKDRFKRNLEDMAKMVDGTIPTVTTMKLEDIQVLTSEAFISTLFNRTNFVEGDKELKIPLSLEDPKLRGYAAPPKVFREAISSSISDSRNLFLRIRGKQKAKTNDDDTDSISYEVVSNFPGSESSKIVVREDGATSYVIRMGLDDKRDGVRSEAQFARLVQDLQVSVPSDWKAWAIEGFSLGSVIMCKTCALRTPGPGVLILSREGLSVQASLSSNEATSTFELILVFDILRPGNFMSVQMPGSFRQLPPP